MFYDGEDVNSINVDGYCKNFCPAPTQAPGGYA